MTVPRSDELEVARGGLAVTVPRTDGGLRGDARGGGLFHGGALGFHGLGN